MKIKPFKCQLFLLRPCSAIILNFLLGILGIPFALMILFPASSVSCLPAYCGPLFRECGGMAWTQSPTAALWAHGTQRVTQNCPPGISLHHRPGDSLFLSCVGSLVSFIFFIFFYVFPFLSLIPSFWYSMSCSRFWKKKMHGR